MKKSKKVMIVVIPIALIAILLCVRAYNKSRSDDSNRFGDNEVVVVLPESSDNASYYDYLKKYDGAKHPKSEILLEGKDYTDDDGADVSITSYQGVDQVVYWDSEQGSLTWSFDVAEAGFYNLAIQYCPITIKGNEIHMGIKIDGEYPYRNVEVISLARTFLDETYIDMNNNAFRKDSAGNDIRPKAEEVFRWQETVIIDGDGQYTGALSFYLDEGQHTLTLDMKMEGAAIQSLQFFNVEENVSYEQALALWNAAGVHDTSGHEIIVQAENSYLKSHNILFPTFDKSQVSIQPSDAHHTVYNTLGKNTWDAVGQYVTWEVDVPEDGYYNLAFKVKQNVKRGMYSVRELMIDDEILFNEMEDLKFDFKNSWYMYVFQDTNEVPYKVYLTKGKHEIRMNITVGEVSDILRRVDEAVEALNKWYREIVKITGTNADSDRITIDSNRDFLLDQKIPGLMEGFADIQKSLESVMEDIRSMEGIEETSATIVSETIALMESFIKKPGKIANRIESYRGTMSSLATWTVDMRAQPLEMDYFVLYSPDVQTPKISKNIFKQIAFRSKMFVDSFTTDYNNLGGEEDAEQVLTVWVSTADMAGTGGIASGRDQAMLLKRLIDDMFTPMTGIPVQVSLVNSSDTLTQAVLAGKGPDVALFVTKETPVNLAMRGALLNLSDYDDFDEVITQFMPSAIIPYEYRGAYYALPETQSYDMLFYRTDIFEQLGVEPPDTWKDFYALIPILMENNFLTGIPESQRTFEMFLYQYGGQFYNDDLTKTAFDTPEALKAFEDWTGLYAKYSLPLVFDFFNRFRTGEMPMAIMPYTQVNYLTVAAPELKDLWDISPIPGTLKEDGTINRSETSNGTAGIIIADTKYPDQAYEFLKWWVSTEVQSRFGIELEQNMGPAARYPTANVAAFEELPWTKAQSESLMEQWINVTDVPQIPGNYYISRNISFAFRAVVYKKENERESLFKYNKEINKEITRKLKEFELIQ